MKSTEKWNIGLKWVNAEKFLLLDTISTSKNKELHCYNYDYFEVDKHTLRKKCLYSELFWSVFSRIRTEYEVSLRIQSKCLKLRTRVIPNTDTFYAM